MSAIVVKNLVKHFKPPKKGNAGRNDLKNMKETMSTIRAVDDVSFEVRKGEVFGFLGPNGAGKTTTIRMLTGVLKPTSGKVSIFGKNVWKNQVLVKQITGNVPEEANVYMDLSGLQNLIFIGEIYGIPKNIRLERSKALLKKFELFDKRNLKALKYSKGMKQRLLLCMALMSDPKILFLDEPTTGLDVQSALIIKQLIREYNKKGVTIFLTTHDMEVANELCDRIAIISQGRIISLDTPNNLKNFTQEYKAIDFYLTNGVNKSSIEELNTVIEVQEVQEGFHVIVEDVHESLCEIIDFIKQNQLIIKQLNTHQPKLEDAFLKIIERGGKIG